MANENIEPCLFCGSKLTTMLNQGTRHPQPFSVACFSCHADGPSCCTEADAIYAWNRAALEMQELRAQQLYVVNLISSGTPIMLTVESIICPK